MTSIKGTDVTDMKQAFRLLSKAGERYGNLKETTTARHSNHFVAVGPFVQLCILLTRALSPTTGSS